VKILVLSPARLREPSLHERFQYYQKLLRKRISIESRLVKTGTLSSAVPKGWYCVALDEGGRAVNSVQLARWLEKRIASGITGIAFLIGGADGLTDEDRQGADDVLSLSSLTLPHQLCFVVLSEQIYRATSIINREPYHRE
jgi:23S rRNA (pseudouridine1915-N3)-methyltransferase